MPDFAQLEAMLQGVLNMELDSAQLEDMLEDLLNMKKFLETLLQGLLVLPDTDHNVLLKLKAEDTLVKCTETMNLINIAKELKNN